MLFSSIWLLVWLGTPSLNRSLGVELMNLLILVVRLKNLKLQSPNFSQLTLLLCLRSDSSLANFLLSSFYRVLTISCCTSLNYFGHGGLCLLNNMMHFMKEMKCDVKIDPNTGKTRSIEIKLLFITCGVPFIVVGWPTYLNNWITV